MASGKLAAVPAEVRLPVGQVPLQHGNILRRHPQARSTPRELSIHRRRSRRKRGEQAVRIDAAHAEGAGARGQRVSVAGEWCALLQRSVDVNTDPLGLGWRFTNERPHERLKASGAWQEGEHYTVLTLSEEAACASVEA